MKKWLIPIDGKMIKTFYTARPYETKIGQVIQCISDVKNWEDELKHSTARFVILGVPEDIGVRANLGRAGAHSAFKAMLRSFLSMQDNDFLKSDNILLLGEIEVSDLMENSKKLDTKNKQDIQTLRTFVEELDRRVVAVLKVIFKYNKIPIIIGGGHNNSYPIIRAYTELYSVPINIINCDAHSDLRPMEGRHSGNAFRYAMEEGRIQRYHILGFHEQYTSQSVWEYIQQKPVTYYSYEDMFIREKLSFKEALLNSVDLLGQSPCGIELDMDSITNVPASARTSSGISPIDARKYIYFCSNKLNCVYLHLTEAAPETAHLRADYKTGKLLAYLTCDFIKAIHEKSNAITR